jgi:hypothetical protein
VTVIAWEVPPGGRSAKYDLAVGELVLDLKGNPGKWALVIDGLSKSTSSSTPYIKRLKAQGCEATSRLIGDERKVWARYVG